MKQVPKMSAKIKYDPFCSELSRYNKTHRLVGNVSCETLVRESFEAVQASMSSLSEKRVMVDVGAGSGVLGYAWLLAHPENKVLFLEPDKKAVAFLHLFFATDKNTQKRTKVIGKRLEELNNEELLSFEADIAKVFLAARAFSGSESLESCYEKSKLDVPLYSFEKNADSFILRNII
jgi:16S rRNA G527 N7-methylase RsmG